MSDFEHISGSVDEELIRARARELRAGVVDPEELATDLALVEFNPDYATDLPDIAMVINHREERVHQTRNFPLIFKAADYRLRRKTKPDATRAEQAVAEAMHTSKYTEILVDLKMEVPALFARMREIADNLEEQRTGKSLHGAGEVFKATEEELAEWTYISSAAYNQAASIARGLDPDYDLSQLYLRPLF